MKPTINKSRLFSRAWAIAKGKTNVFGYETFAEALKFVWAEMKAYVSKEVARLAEIARVEAWQNSDEYKSLPKVQVINPDFVYRFSGTYKGD